MSRNAEVTVGSYGHVIRITTETDLQVGSPTLKMVFRDPDETTETEKTASIDLVYDASGKTLKYTTVDGDFHSVGEVRIVAKVSASGQLHFGRPALRVQVGEKYQ